MKGNTYEDFARFGQEELDLIEQILADQPATVCEWYCRTGQMAIELAKHAIAVTAIDPDLDYIRFAKSKMDSGNVSWLVGDLTDINNQTFDSIYVPFLNFHFLLGTKPLSELCQASLQYLSPGGKIYFSVRNAAKKMWLRNETAGLIDTIYLQNGDEVETWDIAIAKTDTQHLFERIYHNLNTNETQVERLAMVFPTKEEIIFACKTAGFSTINVYGSYEGAPPTMDCDYYYFVLTKETDAIDVNEDIARIG